MNISINFEMVNQSRVMIDYDQSILFCYNFFFDVALNMSDISIAFLGFGV